MKLFGRDALHELSEDYLQICKELEDAKAEARVAWQESARMGRVIAQYDARVKTRVEADTRVRTAEETARVLTNRQTAADVFWTSVLNGEYDEGHIPVPTEPAGEYDEIDLAEECE